MGVRGGTSIYLPAHRSNHQIPRRPQPYHQKTIKTIQTRPNPSQTSLHRSPSPQNPLTPLANRLSHPSSPPLRLDLNRSPPNPLHHPKRPIPPSTSHFPPRPLLPHSCITPPHPLPRPQPAQPNHPHSSPHYRTCPYSAGHSISTTQTPIFPQPNPFTPNTPPRQRCHPHGTSRPKKLPICCWLFRRPTR